MDTDLYTTCLVVIIARQSKMDRGKNVPTKSNKSKPMGFTGDFIALGSKQSRTEPVDAKTKSATSTSGVITPNVSSLATSNVFISILPNLC